MKRTDLSKDRHGASHRNVAQLLVHDFSDLDSVVLHTPVQAFFAKVETYRRTRHQRRLPGIGVRARYGVHRMQVREEAG